jgi:YVTN family beta-propeller protein
LAAVLASCGGEHRVASSPATTLPPLPPQVVAYVTVAGSGADAGLGDTVVPVEVSSGSVGVHLPTVRVGTFPDAIAIAPDGLTAYVTNYVSDTVTPIDLATDKAGKAIPAGPGPAGIAIAPDGRTAYVTDAGSSPIGHTVTPIDLVTGRALAPIPVGDGPQGIAITPDGSTAFVADAGAIVAGQTGAIGHTVTPIDLATATALPPIDVGNAPVAVAVSPDGTVAEVANSSSDSVTPVAVASRVPGAPVALDGSPQALAFAPGSAAMLYVAVAPSGVGPGDDITPISVATSTAEAPIPACKSPEAVAVTGRTAWVTCFGAGEIVPVDLASRRAGPAVAVAGGPYALALAVHPQGGPTTRGHGDQRARPKR